MLVSLWSRCTTFCSTATPDHVERQPFVLRRHVRLDYRPDHERGVERHRFGTPRYWHPHRILRVPHARRWGMAFHNNEAFVYTFGTLTPNSGSYGTIYTASGGQAQFNDPYANCPCPTWATSSRFRGSVSANNGLFYIVEYIDPQDIYVQNANADGLPGSDETNNGTLTWTNTRPQATSAAELRPARYRLRHPRLHPPVPQADHRLGSDCAPRSQGYRVHELHGGHDFQSWGSRHREAPAAGTEPGQQKDQSP